MRITVTLVLLLTVVATVAAAGEVELSYGPPVSPVAWQGDKSVQPALSAQTIGELGVLRGVSSLPSSVQMVTLHDSRPFGAPSQRPVVLARVDGVEVRSPDGMSTATLNLNVAVDPETSELVCAFTDPTDRWVESSLEQGAGIPARADKAGWSFETPHGAGMRSTLTEVMEATWKRFGVELERAGQIVVRPRFVDNKYPADEIDGTLVPRYPPTNVWVVEVLGMVIMERRVHGQERVLTRLVAQFRDGDLEGLPSMILP